MAIWNLLSVTSILSILSSDCAHCRNSRSSIDWDHAHLSEHIQLLYIMSDCILYGTLFLFIYFLIWLCWVLAVACRIFSYNMTSLTGGMWNVLNPGTLHWECGVLASGPPGKSPVWNLKKNSPLFINFLSLVGHSGLQIGWNFGDTICRALEVGLL